MTTSELNYVQGELAQLLRFMPGVITYNGVTLNKSVHELQWDIETDEAYIKFDPAMHSLDVYNAGMLVTHYPKYRFGRTGIVVTKAPHTLALNMARNDILQAECKVWAKIQPLVQVAKDKPKPERKLKSTEHQLCRFGAQVGAKTLSFTEAVKQEPDLLTSVHGRTIPLSYVTNQWATKPVVFTPKGDPFGKHLSKLKMAEVLDIQVLKRLGLSSAQELKELVLAEAPEAPAWTSHDRLKERVWSDAPKALFADLAAGKKILATADLSKEEVVVVRTWRANQASITKRLVKLFPHENDLIYRLKFSLGEQASKESFLDRTAKVWAMDRKDAVKQTQRGTHHVAAYALAQVKGICLALSTSEEQGLKAFANFCTETDGVGNLTLGLVHAYVRCCLNEGLQAPRAQLNELEMANLE